MKRYLLLSLIILSLICFVLLPNEYIGAAKTGIDICLYTIIPSLLPFFIVSNVLIYSNLLLPLQKIFHPISYSLFGLSGNFIFVYLMSALSGYPCGAKLTSELYNNNKITKNESERMAIFTSVTGPAFIIFVSTMLLKIPSAFIYILASHHISMIFFIFLFTSLFKKNKDIIPMYSVDNSYKSLSECLNASIFSAVKTLSLVCSLVIVFYTLSAIIQKSFLIIGIGDLSITVLLFSLLEMTLGSIKISGLDISVISKTCLISLTISFSGLSIITQTKTVLKTSKIKTKWFTIYKLIHGALAYIVCYFLQIIFPIKTKTSTVSHIIKSHNFYYMYLPVLILSVIIYSIVYNNKSKN